MRETIESGLGSFVSARLVSELLDSHEEVKKNYFLGGYRLAAVEGGRFSEAAFRILQEVTSLGYTPLGIQLDTQKVIRELENSGGAYPDAVRLHIPRALRLIYDIRNKRDAAHLADGIDANVQDATLVVSVVSWVTAEFVRLYHNVPPEEAFRIVESLVKRQVPIIQDFNGFLKMLKPGMAASDHMLVLLYQRGAAGATYDELLAWARPTMRANLKRTLRDLVSVKDLAYFDNSKYIITALGQFEVEKRRLLHT